MTVEVATHLDDLNTALPLGTNARSEGDDHIRLLKSVLQTDFPAISGAITASQDEINVLDGVTAGTVTASKALVVDSNSRLNTFDIAASGNYSVAGTAILADSAGTLTLSNVDALDATTESTIEAAIDSLTNLVATGALDSGSITAGFGAIDNGTSNVTTGGILKIDVDGTAENAAGSLTMGAGNDAGIFFDGTNLVIISNGAGASGIVLDAEDDTVEIKGSGTLQATFDTGGLNLASGDGYSIAGTSVLNATTLGTNVVASSLTSVGTLTALQVDNVNINGNTIISSDTAGDINITPDTTGDLVLDGVKWPQADGAANQILTTSGAGQASWATPTTTTALTTQGDMLYQDATGLQRLATGTAGQVLQSGGAGANLSWAAAGISASSTDTLTNKTIDANGTGNSITNIDIADLANGTDGELITWDAAGAPAVVAVGTSGQVLTSNGTGAAPTMQDASGGVTDCKFMAYVTSNQSNVTGDGTSYDITGAIWTEVFDTGSDFSNGTFTAPETGKYYLNFTVCTYGHSTLNMGHEMKMVTSNGTYVIESQGTSVKHSNTGQWSRSWSKVVDMDASDTAKINLVSQQTNKFIAVIGGKEDTNFSGALLA
jgi:hypothetical protein